ncbi:MAG: trypsin-like peptidase domain-containing protein [Planctomycetota bacterium]
MSAAPAAPSPSGSINWNIPIIIGALTALLLCAGVVAFVLLSKLNELELLPDPELIAARSTVESGDSQQANQGAESSNSMNWNIGQARPEPSDPVEDQSNGTPSDPSEQPDSVWNLDRGRTNVWDGYSETEPDYGDGYGMDDSSEPTSDNDEELPPDYGADYGMDEEMEDLDEVPMEYGSEYGMEDERDDSNFDELPPNYGGESDYGSPYSGVRIPRRPNRNRIPTSGSSASSGKTSSVEPSPGAAAFGSSSAPVRAGSFADLIEQVEPSVVRLDVELADGKSQGSGFAVDNDGTIVTNYHVIEGAKSVTVKNPNSQRTRAIGFVAIDERRDLAVLKVEPSRLAVQPLPLADQLPRKGSPVAAFGSPLGLDFTAAEGVVSAIRDTASLKESILGSVDASEMPGQGIDMTWLQTTAAISGGNSGGPLVDFNGRLVGVNTWTIQLGQSLNFAISVDEVRDILRKRSSAIQAWSQLPPVRSTSRQRRSGPSLGSETLQTSSPARFETTDIPGAVRALEAYPDAIQDIAVSPDNRYFAVCSIDGTTDVFRRTDGRATFRVKTTESPIVDVAFAGRPQRLFTFRSAGAAESISVRDQETGQRDGRHQLIAPHSKLGKMMAVSPDARSIFASWITGLTQYWRFDRLGHSFSTVKLVDGMMMIQGAVPTTADFTPDGNTMVVGSSNGWVSTVSIKGHTIESGGQHESHDSEVNEVQYYNDGRALVSCGDDGQVVMCRNLQSDSWRITRLTSSRQASALSIDVSADDKRLAVARDNGAIEVYELARRRRLDQIPARDSPATKVRFTADGKFLIAGFADGIVAMYPAP